LDLGGIRLLRIIEKRAITAHIRGLVDELIQILISNDENVYHGNIAQEAPHTVMVARDDLEQTVNKMKNLELKRTSVSPVPIFKEDEVRMSFRTMPSPHNIHRRLSPERFLKKPQGDLMHSDF
jgi:hypothetical protein